MASPISPTPGSRRRRRVVALSVRDQQLVARGGVPEDLARADYERDALSDVSGVEGGVQGGANSGSGGDATSNDARLLADVPPHWQ